MSTSLLYFSNRVCRTLRCAARLCVSWATLKMIRILHLVGHVEGRWTALLEGQATTICPRASVSVLWHRLHEYHLWKFSASSIVSTNSSPWLSNMLAMVLSSARGWSVSLFVAVVEGVVLSRLTSWKILTHSGLKT